MDKPKSKPKHRSNTEIIKIEPKAVQIMNRHRKVLDNKRKLKITSTDKKSRAQRQVKKQRGIPNASLSNEKARNISQIEHSLDNKIISNNLLNSRIEYNGLNIAVIIHLFYIDLWSELRIYLGNFIGIKFDLYVNLVESSAEYKEIEKTKQLILKFYPNAKVFISDNRGMDVGGTFTILNYMYQNNLTYDSILKIHGKKSLHSTNVLILGEQWRKELYNSLMGSPTIIKNNLKLLFLEPSIGLISSSEWMIHASYKSIYFAGNRLYMDEYLRKFRMEKLINRSLTFIAGTMFWIDGKTFLDFFRDKNVLQLRNELEYGSFSDNDGPKRTHSFERIFSLLVTNANKNIIGI